MIYKNPEEIDSDLSESESESETEESDPSDLSDPKTEESDEENQLDAVSLSAFEMIFNCMWKIDVLVYLYVKEFIERPNCLLGKEDCEELLYYNLVKQPLVSLSLFKDNELGSVSSIYASMTKLLFPWSKHFQVREKAAKICKQCKTETNYYSGEECFGISINANSLRVYKSEFKDFTFENILKAIKINLKMPCHKEGCGKPTYVETTIHNHPSGFAIAIEWEGNETKEEIFETVSVIKTEMDISGVYRCVGEGADTIYSLVSMVISDGDLYGFVIRRREGRCFLFFPNENNKREAEFIGDWDSVLELHSRPEILFFENVKEKADLIGTLSSQDY
ncbi:unnamed protein product [Cochlearia groenlandica]